MAAIAGRRLAAVAKVPDFSGRPRAPSLRGKNSYHEPTRARRRSTSSGHGPHSVTPARIGWASSAASTSGSPAAARRTSGGNSLSRTVRVISANRLRSPPVSDSMSCAPSSSSMSISTPAGTLMLARCHQVPQGSSQASIEKDHRPWASVVISAPQMSSPVPRSRMRVLDRSRPAGSRSTTSTPRDPWPSRKTVARTGTTSSTTALAGVRPDSTTGQTSVTGILPVSRAGTSTLLDSDRVGAFFAGAFFAGAFLAGAFFAGALAGAFLAGAFAGDLAGALAAAPDAAENTGTAGGGRRGIGPG